ncbi:MAG TPA: hypothetical protein VFH39_02440, partial [Candidatus Saccharimonadales bacterium]|nr:hypothetical protein [Candidatus Saccharimonadales bacterium]
MTRVARAEGPGPSDNFIPRPEITRRVLSAVAAADGEVISEQESVPSADAALSTGNELISARSEDNSDSPEVEIEGSSVEEAETGDFEWDDEE